MSEVLGWAFRIADWGCLLWAGAILAQMTHVLIGARSGKIPVLDANQRMLRLLVWMALFGAGALIFRAAASRLLQGS